MCAEIPDPDRCTALCEQQVHQVQACSLSRKCCRLFVSEYAIFECTELDFFMATEDWHISLHSYIIAILIDEFLISLLLCDAGPELSVMSFFTEAFFSHCLK